MPHRVFKYCGITACAMAVSITAAAQAYIYIQGDKLIPFYVKALGKMMPRYGKNHCIISNIHTGEIAFDILFQQHSYPPLHFSIAVPSDGYRGFLLHKTEQGFDLYDLHEKKYIAPLPDSAIQNSNNR